MNRIRALRLRRLIALAAAYALALQAVLLPLTLTANAALHATLCSSDRVNTGTPSAPAQSPGEDCPCALSCGLHAVPATVPPDTVALRTEFSFGLIEQVDAGQPLTLATLRTPHAARAPPRG